MLSINFFIWILGPFQQGIEYNFNNMGKFFLTSLKHWLQKHWETILQ